MWEILLFISLLAGQLGRIQMTPSIAFYVHDIVIFFYLLSHIKKIKVSFFKPLIIAFGVYLLFRAGTFVGFLYVLRLFLYVSVIFLVLQSKKTQLYWLKWLYYLGVGYAVLGFIQLFLYPNLRNLSYLGWDPHYYRLFSTLFDPNFVGCFLVVCFILGLYLYTGAKSKLYSIFSQMLLLVALLLTYSRSSFVSFFAGLMMYIVLTKKWIYFFLLLLFLFSLFYFPSIGGISTEIGRMWSVTARVTNWQEGTKLFLDSPIIGNGFTIRRIDNSVLFILVTTGVIGLIGFAKLVMYFIQSNFRIKKQLLKTTYFSILAALFIHSMFVNTLFYPQILIWFWIFIGAISRS